MPNKRMRPIIKEEPGVGGAQELQQQQEAAARQRLLLVLLFVAVFSFKVSCDVPTHISLLRLTVRHADGRSQTKS